MVGLRVLVRLRMSQHEAHYAGELVDGARMLGLFGDLATELLIRVDGDEGLFRAYESVEFLAPVFAGDYIEASAELVRMGRTSREMVFEARKVIANARQPELPASAADVLQEPVVVCRARGTCVTPIDLQRHPKGLYMPALPAAAAPPVITPPPGDAAELIITAAIVGAEVTRDKTPHVPITPKEIADEAARCVDAGASIVHLHVRTDDGAPTQAAERFAETIDAIREKADCVIQTSTGGAIGMTLDERAGPLRCQPEMATLNCGTLNFGDAVFVNSRPEILDMAKRIRDAGAVPELECYEVGHVEEALRLIESGAVSNHAHLQFVLGVPGGIGATEKNLAHLVSLLPSGMPWSVAAVGRHQRPLTELAMRWGGHVRLGLEDNIYLDKGVLAEGSAPLVERARAYAEAIGRKPLDAQAVRKRLGLAP